MSETNRTKGIRLLFSGQVGLNPTKTIRMITNRIYGHRVWRYASPHPIMFIKLAFYLDTISMSNE